MQDEHVMPNIDSTTSSSLGSTTTSASKPMSSIASTTFSGVQPHDASYVTVARSASRATVTSRMPSCFPNIFSMLETHAPHVIPLTWNLCVSPSFSASDIVLARGGGSK